METVLKEYFTEVFREDFFVVALDRTGCYLFTDSSDDSEIGRQFTDFLESISLRKEQVCLCVIGRKSKYNYSDFQHLSEYVLKAKQRRKPVLTDKEVNSILQCYDIEKLPGRESEEAAPEDIVKDFVPPEGPVLSIEYRVGKFLSVLVLLLICALFSVMCLRPVFTLAALAVIVLLILGTGRRYGISDVIEIQGVAGFLSTIVKAIGNSKGQFIGMVLLAVLVVVAGFVLQDWAVPAASDVMGWFATAFNKLKNIISSHGV